MAHTCAYPLTSKAQEKKYIAKSSSATGTNLLLDLVNHRRSCGIMSDSSPRWTYRLKNPPHIVEENHDVKTSPLDESYGMEEENGEGKIF